MGYSSKLPKDSDPDELANSGSEFDDNDEADDDLVSNCASPSSPFGI